MSVTEALIEGVKSRPILYDLTHPNYKNLKKKDIVWAELGRQLNEDGEELKKKWKNVKDCYQKYLKTVNVKSGQTGGKRSYKNWQWAQQMEFYRPQTEFSASEIDNQSETVQSSNEDSESFQEGSIRKRRRIIEMEADYSKPSIPLVTSSDATDLIFLGYSKTVKGFSPMRQAIVKMRIAQIMMEEEINNLEEQEPTVSNNSTQIQQVTVEDESQPCTSTTFSMKIEKSELY